MKSAILWGLIGLNVLLVAVYFLDRSPSPAIAQVRRAGDYLTVPGTVTGGTNGVVFIVDQSSGQLSAISFDDANARLDSMRPIDLGRVFAAGAGVAPKANKH